MALASSADLLGTVVICLAVAAHAGVKWFVDPVHHEQQ